MVLSSVQKRLRALLASQSCCLSSQSRWAGCDAQMGGWGSWSRGLGVWGSGLKTKMELCPIRCVPVYSSWVTGSQGLAQNTGTCSLPTWEATIVLREF